MLNLINALYSAGIIQFIVIYVAAMVVIRKALHRGRK